MKVDGIPLPNDSRFWTRPLFHIFLIVLIGVLVYSNSFQVPFVYDDESSITQNHVIKNLHDFLLEGSGYRYNPRRFLGYLSIALNYHWGGLDVTGYHIFNLAVHIATALLVYILARLTLSTPFCADAGLWTADREQTRQPGWSWRSLLPLLAALLFVCHPVQTQAVTYIVQRLASLATLFFVLALVCYLKGRLGAEASGRAFSARPLAWYGIALLAALAAMRTKEISFTLPFVVALFEFSFFRNTLRKKLLFLSPILLCLVVVPLGFLGSERPVGELLSDVSNMTRETVEISRTDYLLTQFSVIATYLRLLVFPVNQNLDYDYPVYTSFFSAPVLLSFLLLLSLLALAGYLHFRADRPGAAPLPRSADAGDSDSGAPCRAPELRLISFGILWFFITLSVESSIIPIRDVIYEHRLYLPSVGAFLAVAAAAVALAQSRRLRWAPFAVLALALVFSAATWLRNDVWQTEISLWRDAAAKSPNKPRPLTNYGFALLKAGRIDQAFEPLQKALALDLSYPPAYNHLGTAFMKKGMVPDAIAAFQNVVAISPDYAEAHRNLGAALSAAGRMEEAVAQLDRALQLDPNSAAAHYNLGLAHQKMGRLQDAVRDYRSASRLDPKYALPYHNLGTVYLALGQTQDAVRELRKAVALDPTNETFRRNLETVLSRTGGKANQRL